MSNSDSSVPLQKTGAPCVIESTPVRTVRNLKKRQSNCDVKKGTSTVIDDSDEDRRQQLQQQQQQQQTLPPIGFQRQSSSKPSTTSSASMKSFTENQADLSNSSGNSNQVKSSVSARQILDEELNVKRSDMSQHSQQQSQQQQASGGYKRRPQKNQQASSTLIQRKPSQSQSEDNYNDLPSATLSSTTSPIGGGIGGERDSTAAGTVQHSQTFSSRIDSMRVSVPLKQMAAQSSQQSQLQQQQSLQQQQQQKEGPLGDKTNTFSEKRGFRRSKTKIPTTKDFQQTGATNNDNDFESPDQTTHLQQYQQMASMGGISQTANVLQIAEQHIKEFVNIDIEYAVHFLVSKSKAIKELLGGDDAMAARNAQNVIDSRIFKISYGAFVQQQVHRKVLSQDFRNVSKKAFEKLEKFVVQQIEKQQQKIGLQSTYVKSSKAVQSLFDQRIAALKRELIESKNAIFL